MKTYIALFRGINVGGHNLIKMNDLVTLCEGLGFAHVRTYIQSGNLVFDCPETALAILEKKLADAVMSAAGFRPAMMVFSPEMMTAVVANNPFPEAVETPQFLQLYFLVSSKSITDNDMAALQALAIPSERFSLIGRCFYLHAPEGIGRSKLAVKVENILGVPMTCRNWRTVMRIQALVVEMPGYFPPL